MALPVTLYASAVAYSLSILSLTNHRSFWTRVILWIVIATSNAVAVANTKNLTDEIWHNWWWTLLTIHQTVFMAYLYCLNRINLCIPEHLPYLQRLMYAWWLFWNYRGINTPWQVGYVPPERLLGYKVERARTRKRFLKIRVVNLLAFYLAMCLWYDPLVEPHLSPNDFSKDKDSFFRRLGEVDFRELRVRLYMTANHIIPAWMTMNAVVTSISILAVLLGGKPEDWPPLFGDISEAYSLRRYWRRFWHPLIRRSFPSTGSLFLEHICNVQRGTPLHSVGNTFLVFFLSSLMHYGAESHWIGLEGARAELWWWSLQAPMIMAEKIVQAAYLRLKPEMERRFGLRIGHGWEKLVGYAWVFLFMFWSVPKLEYAKHREVWNL